MTITFAFSPAIRSTKYFWGNTLTPTVSAGAATMTGAVTSVPAINNTIDTAVRIMIVDCIADNGL
jgi:hypothetical protein